MNVTIIYEIFNREYDNALLLKCALERYGYDVCIISKNDLFYRKKHSWREILVVPNCYTTDDYDYYYYANNNSNVVIVNLQYEQVLSNNQANISFHNPTGKALKAHHLCWGNSFYDFLKDNNVKNVFRTGALHMDFLRKDFLSYWISKDEIMAEHDIPKNKKILLFISSFSCANNENVKFYISKQLGEKYAEDFSELSTISRKKLTEWFERFVMDDGISQDICIVYRKHPMEIVDNRLQELELTSCGRFKLIDDYNIKQWIEISDYIYTWYSTSAVECYVANKPFGILRPIKIPKEYEVDIYNDASFICQYDDFMHHLFDENRTFPISEDVIKERYYIDDIPAYERICKVIQTLSKETTNNNDTGKYDLLRNRYIRLNHFKLKENLKRIYLLLYGKGFKIKNKYLRRKFAFDVWENREKQIHSHGDETVLNSIVRDYYKNHQ